MRALRCSGSQRLVSGAHVEVHWDIGSPKTMGNRQLMYITAEK